jgi:hypothetical protein
MVQAPRSARSERVVALALTALALAGGCVTAPTEMSQSAQSDDEGAPAAPAPAPAPAPSTGPAALFNALEGDFVTSCAICHEAGGVSAKPFLNGPDRYASVKAWPGIVVPEATHSLLLTYPFEGHGHPGTNLDSTGLKTTLLPALQKWLVAEAGTLKAPHPVLPSFAPVLGFNAVELDSLGPGFESIALTFEASELGPGALLLSSLDLHPTAHAGVRVAHPLFSVLASGAIDPDPVDSFSELDQVFVAGEPAQLGCGTLILTNWAAGAELDIGFDHVDLEPVPGNP